MTLEEFIDKNDVEKSKNLVDEMFVLNSEKFFHLSFGPQLKKYILNYGYLAFRSVEFYGINSLQEEKSDMIFSTSFLHKNFPKTAKFVALENLGEGIYALVDGNDDVFLFDSLSKKIKPLKLKMFDYILKSFQAAEWSQRSHFNSLTYWH